MNFEEFCGLASRFMEEDTDTEAMQQELREAFRLYDKEGNGYITTDVFRDILHELDDALSPEELDMIIDEVDADGSGTVDFEGTCTSDCLRFVQTESCDLADGEKREKLENINIYIYVYMFIINETRRDEDVDSKKVKIRKCRIVITMLQLLLHHIIRLLDQSIKRIVLSFEITNVIRGIKQRSFHDFRIHGGHDRLNYHLGTRRSSLVVGRHERRIYKRRYRLPLLNTWKTRDLSR